MADYHILLQDENKRSISVVFHIPVPAIGQNQAGIGWRSAVVKEQGGSDNIISILKDIDPAEETKLKAGEIIEKPETVIFSSMNLTNAQRKVAIENRFSALKTELINEKQKTLEWIGYSGNVI